MNKVDAQNWWNRNKRSIIISKNIRANVKPKQEGPRVNHQIQVPEVRLVDENGEMVGIVSLSEALRRAENVGLDLIEISPQAEPPVCKLLDNGKYKYELQKKKNEAKKNQKIIEIKEIKLRPMIGDHDYEIKLKQMKKFLSEGDKVKVTLRYRGREMAHKELGFKVFERVTRDVEGFGTPDNQPAFEGRQVLMMVSPVK